MKDRRKGPSDLCPLLLEVNARPGLAIQIANGRGLMPRLREIEETLARVPEAVPLPSREAMAA